MTQDSTQPPDPSQEPSADETVAIPVLDEVVVAGNESATDETTVGESDRPWEADGRETSSPRAPAGLSLGDVEALTDRLTEEIQQALRPQFETLLAEATQQAVQEALRGYDERIGERIREQVSDSLLKHLGNDPEPTDR